MKKNFPDVLLEILNIIQYPNDKEKYVIEFEELNRTEALANLLEDLPLEIQEKIKETNEYEKGIEIKKYLQDEVYFAEVTAVSEEALARLIESLLPNLTSEQQENIRTVVTA